MVREARNGELRHMPSVRVHIMPQVNGEKRWEAPAQRSGSRCATSVTQHSQIRCGRRAHDKAETQLIEILSIAEDSLFKLSDKSKPTVVRQPNTEEEGRGSDHTRRKA